MLQFLLDKQPPGFPLTPMPLWQLLCQYTLLHNAACVAQQTLGMSPAAALAAAGSPPPLPMPILSSMQDILALNQAYMAHFAPRVPREGEAAEPVMPPTSSTKVFKLEKMMVETLVNARYTILLTLGMRVDGTSGPREPLAKQLEEQLWLSPAVADASLAQLAAWCQHHFNQHSNNQQQQPKQGKMGKGKQKQRNCGSHSKSACNNNGSSSSSSTKDESSSNSNFATFNFPSASSWSELQVLPDHEQVAVAGGNLAVAAHLWRVARVHKRMTAVELRNEFFLPAGLLKKSLAPALGLQEGEGDPMPGDVRLSSRPAAAATAMQLSLQALAFKGMEVEAAAPAGTGESRAGAGDSSIWSTFTQLVGYSLSGTLGLDIMLQLLFTQVIAADGATRRAFLSARGGYALQVLWLVMRYANQHEEQHQQLRRQQQGQVSEVVELVPRIMSRVCRAADGDMIHVRDGKDGMG